MAAHETKDALPDAEMAVKEIAVGPTEAEEYLKNHEIEYGVYSDEEVVAVRRKIDWRLMPLIMTTTILAAIDKIAVSNAELYGMSKDTHLVGRQYNWVGSIFYFGYLISQMPANYSLQKLPVGKALAGAVTFWGAVVMLLGAAQNFGGLAALRFLMGCAEAFLFPCCVILLTMFYTTSEQPTRTALTFSAFSSVIMGLISYGIGHSKAAIAAWRLLFIVLGSATIVWGMVLFLFLPDSPVRARFLNPKEKVIAINRVKENMTGIESKEFKLYQVKEALLDYKTWCLFLFFLSMNVPTGGLITFAAQIVSGLGYPRLETTLLGMPTGVIQTAAGFGVAYSQRWMKNKRCLCSALCCLVPLATSIIIRKLPAEQKVGRLMAYYFFYFFWGPYATVLSLPMANVSGHTKKLTVSGVIFVAYCTANIIGPQVFIVKEAPNYTTGYNSIMAFEIVAIASLAVYAFGCWYENKRRDRNEGVNVDVQAEDLLGDFTDKEKKGFRYVY